MQMISQIENAMVAALVAAASAFRVDTIESYGGQLDDDTLEWIRRLPAIWVVFAGGAEPKPAGTEKGKWLYQGTFTVFCGQRNLKGNKALRQGDATNPGVYALMQVAKVALLHKDLGLAIKEFKPGAIRPVTSLVVNNDAVMVYAMNWATEWFELADVPELLPEGDLVTIGLEYFIKPGDDVADTADQITTRTL